MNQARTCVITVNYKGAEDTTACLASLQYSTVPVFIVVVDNTPNDLELESSISSFSNVKLIRAPENLGFSRGNNLGIEWALESKQFEYILILNNDTTIQPDAIEKLQETLDMDLSIGLATCRIVLAEEPSILWYGGGEINWKRGSATIPGMWQASTAPLAMESREVGFASGCAMLIRREVLQKVGGFDPLFFMYEEDVDLSLRIRKFYSIFYNSSALIFHVGQGSQRKNAKLFQGKWSASNPNFSFHVYHMVRNSVINARKHAKGIDRLVWIVFYPLFLLKKTIPASKLLGLLAFKPVISGLLDGMRVKPDAWRL